MYSSIDDAINKLMAMFIAIAKGSQYNVGKISDYRMAQLIELLIVCLDMQSI